MNGGTFRWAAVGAALACCALALSAAPMEANAPTERRIVTVRVNGQVVAPSAFVLDTGGSLMLRREDLASWGLDAPAAPAGVFVAGNHFIPLEQLPGVRYTVDSELQELLLDVGREALAEAVVSAQPSRYMAPTASANGAFLNYEVVGAGFSGESSQLNGIFDVGLFNRFGTGTMLYAMRDRGLGRQFIRLQTNWVIDRPEKVQTVILGDANAPGGSWWRSVGFGGIQWGTNFGIRPDYRTYPLPSYSGEAIPPSVFELYVDDSLRFRERIPSRAFTVENLPVVTGSGDFRVVVRDPLGREVVYEQPFYLEPKLLRDGLRDFSYSLGAVRQNLGDESNNYGRLAALITERRGLSDRITLEAHAELLADQQAIGAGAIMLAPRLGIFDMAVAYGRDDEESGGLVEIGFNRQQKNLTFGFQAEFAQEGFARLDSARVTQSPKQDLRARLAYSTRKIGSLAAGYAKRELHRGGGTSELLSFSFRRRLPRNSFLSVTVLDASTEDLSDRSIGIAVTRLFGTSTTASVSTELPRDGSEGQTSVQIQRPAPVGPGLGFRLALDAGARERISGSTQLNTSFAALGVELLQDSAGAGWRTTATGAIAAVGRSIFATRLIRRSVGLARVGSYKGIRVFHENQLIGRTNRRGYVSLPGLLPYQRNSVRFAEQDLPLDAEFGRNEAEVSPRQRSGLIVDFDVRQSSSRTVEIRLPGGEPIPVGSFVHPLAGEGQRAPVGERGLAFVGGVEQGARYEVRMPDGDSCFVEIDLGLALENGTLGPYSCRLEDDP